MKKLVLIACTVAGFIGTGFAGPLDWHKGPLSRSERALAKQNLVGEMYNPDEPSGHCIAGITANGKSGKLLFYNFGIEDATAARSEGKSMADFHYTTAQANQFLFAEGWSKYHDRFFTRAYVQEGMAAFDKETEQLNPKQ